MKNILHQLLVAIALSLMILGLGVPPAAGQDATSGMDGPDVEGTWEGTLSGRLKIVFHLRRGGDGQRSATMDVPAQGAEGLPVGTVAVTADSLRLEVAGPGITFAGKIQNDGETVDGTWTQGGQSLPLVLERTSTEAPGPAEAPAEVRRPGEPDVTGRWMGRITTPTGQELRIVFNIAEAGSDTLTATAKSPDQSDQAIPVSALALIEDSLRLEMQMLGAHFEGQIGAGAEEIDGTFRQRGWSTPLTLRRTEEGEDAAGQDRAPAERPRPQEPEPPFPYETEEVTYPGGAEGVTLAGTLTIPEGAGPHPAVVLISGSGPQNRNEAIFGHKPFLVLADYLTRRGVAVLRYDERGIGASTGSLTGLTSDDLAGDVQAVLDYLRSRNDLNLGKLGLIGHSEGGLIAPMLAARTEAVDFLVLLAASSVPGDQIIAEQVERLVRAQSGSSKEAAEQRAVQERLLAAVTQAPDSAAAAERVRAVLEEEGMGNAEASIQALTRPWYRRFLSYDPRPALQKLDVPVLALYGTKDVQVAADQNAPVAREALADHPDATVEVLSDLNHLFQTAETGLPGEYGQIAETFDPAALERIGDWIAERTSAEE